MGGFVFIGLLAIFTILFVAPLILGFYVVGQRLGLRPLQGYLGGVLLLVFGVILFGVIAVFANIDQSMQFMADTRIR
jgi:hypothetical protein